MGAFLEKPKTDKTFVCESGNGLTYAVCSMQGWRLEMEDSHTIKLSLPGGMSEWSYFGVFDGHAGSRVSTLCASHLLDSILQTPVFSELIKSGNVNLDAIKSAIVEGFLNYDRTLLQDNMSERSGSTAVIAFVNSTHIFFANCGDSRALLMRNGQPAFSTEDHKPCNTQERLRINRAGGHVVLSRVNGSLAVSRSLGDFDYKRVKDTAPSDQLVSPEPDVIVIERSRDTDQMIVLACDGIWDTFSNDELCRYLVHRLQCRKNLADVAVEALDTSLYKGSKDNMSILLVSLDKVPEYDNYIAQLDQELDASIRNIAEETIERANQTNSSITSTYVATVIQASNLANYPPGGFVTKRGLVESICAAHLLESDHASINNTD